MIAVSPGTTYASSVRPTTRMSCVRRARECTTRAHAAKPGHKSPARRSSAPLMKWPPPCDSVGIKCQSRPLGRKKEEPMEKDTVVAVDIAKSVFDAAVSQEPGRVAERRRLGRGVFLLFFAQWWLASWAPRPTRGLARPVTEPGRSHTAH